MSYSDKLIELKEQEHNFLQKIEDTKRDIQRYDNAEIPFDVPAYQGLKNKLENSETRLKEIQQQISELEGAAESAQSELTNEFDDIGGSGFSLRALVATEEAYQIVSIFLKQKIGDMVEQHAAVVHSYKSENTMLSETITELYKVKDECEELQRENIQLGDQLADMTSKRAAASSELESLKAENARLKEDNTKLREQLVNKNTAPRDISEEIKKYADDLRAKIKPIYNVRWKDELRKTHYLATLAETGEEIEIPHYAINGYRQLEGEELARFQEEQEAKRAAAEVEDPIQLAPSLPIPNAQVPTDSIPGEVAPEATEVTRAEFEALANRVTQLEQMNRGVA